jgi:hypothetical protein
VFLLPVDFSYDQLVSAIKSTVSRRCLKAEQVPLDCPVKLAVPLAGSLGLQVSVLNNDDLLEAMDLFQDAFDTMPLDKLPGYDESHTPPLSPSEERRPSIPSRAPEDFVFQDCADCFDGSIDIELGLW